MRRPTKNCMCACVYERERDRERVCVSEGGGVRGSGITKCKGKLKSSTFTRAGERIRASRSVLVSRTSLPRRPSTTDDWEIIGATCARAHSEERERENEASVSSRSRSVRHRFFGGRADPSSSPMRPIGSPCTKMESASASALAASSTG